MKLLLSQAILALCAAQSLIEHGYHSHTDMVKGSCPELVDTIATRGSKFDPKGLMGSWKTVYESKERTAGMDCLTVKFQEFEGANETQVQVLTGHQLVDPENDISMWEDLEGDGVFYDEAFLTFNHPDKGLAAVQTRAELNSTPMQRLLDEMEPLTREQRREMPLDDILLHEKHAELLKDLSLDQLEALAESGDVHSDPYHMSSWQILDTDYERYFISYMCHEVHEHVNAADQTEEMIEELKEQDDSKSYDENYHAETYHFIIAGIHVRNMTTIHQAQLRQYMARLHKMVPGHDFHESRHDMIAHGYKCPAEDEDLFTQPLVHSYQNLLDHMEDGKVHYHHTYEWVRNINQTELEKHWAEEQAKAEALLAEAEAAEAHADL